MMKQINNWLQVLSESERRLILLGTVLIAVAVSWVGIYQPVTKKIAEQAKLKQQLTAQVKQMQDMAVQLSLSGSTGIQSIPAGVTFSAWLDQQLQAVSLQQMVNRTEPIDENTISLWLQGAPFNQVIDWLQSISIQYAVNVEQFDINVVDDSLGLTDIRMRLVK